jgi:type I restriction enzyme S subunit
MDRSIDECFLYIQNGANIKQGEVDGGYPITRIETTANDCFNRDRMGYAGITDIAKYKNYVLEDGDLLMSHINSLQYLGRTVLYEKQVNETIIHGMNLLRLKANREIINPAYAKYCFYSFAFKQQLANITKKSVNQASFAVKDLKRIRIDVPTIDEQNKIVSILDTIKKIIANRQKELAIFDDLIKARFVEMFGDIHNNEKKWNIGVINDIGVCVAGATPSTKVSEYWDNGTIPWMSSGEVNKGRIFQTDAKISQSGYDNASTKLVPPKTVVIAMAGQGKTRGMVAITEIELCTNQSICSIVNNKKIDPEYLLYYLKLQYKELRSASTNTDGRGGLNLKIIGNYPIMIPPINVQNKFGDLAKQIDKSKVAVQKALDEAQLLFDSLMQKYFG